MNLLDLSLSSPAENLACDEALLDAAEAGHCGETLRFWESPTHFVVVGYANRVDAEVDSAACEINGVPILRRCTGGGTVLQGPGCLNYALILKITDDGALSTITRANKFIMERNRQALTTEIRDSKSEIRVDGHTDLAINGLKFSGNSQRRRKSFLLFHGTFLLNFDLELIGKCLRMPLHQPDYRRNRRHDEFITNVGLDVMTVKASLTRAWEALAPGDFRLHAEVSALVKERYGRDEWNCKF